MGGTGWLCLAGIGAGTLAALAGRAMLGYAPRHGRWRRLVGRQPGAGPAAGTGCRMMARLCPRRIGENTRLNWSSVLPGAAMVAAGGVAGSLLLRSAVGLPLGMVATLAILRGQAVRRAVDRAARVREAFPDALMRMAGHLRAGQSLAQAVEAVVASGAGPLEECLGRAIADYRAGLPLVRALGRLEREFPGEATGQFRQVLDLYRLSEGSLADVLDNTAVALAEQQSLMGELEARTTEARLSAQILLVLPLALGLYFWLANPEMLRPLWETPAGRVGSVYGTTSWLVGRELMNWLIARLRAERG